MTADERELIFMTPEQGEAVLATEAGELEEIFELALEQVAAIPSTHLFKKRCKNQGVEMGRPSRPEYWRVIAACGRDFADMERKENGGGLQVDAAELVAATPAYVFAQHALDKRSFPTKSEKDAAWDLTRYYNQAMRYFGERNPQVLVDPIADGLFAAARLFVTDDTIHEEGLDNIDNVLYSARQKANFGHLLGILGERFRVANDKESLFGIDFVTNVDARGSTEIRLDVRTSPVEIQAQGKDTKFSIERSPKWPPTAKILTPFMQYELGDRFVESNEVLRAKAEELRPLLARIHQVA